MIDLNLEFDYPEMPMHFRFSAQKGERIAVVGESGAGKSTLLNLIAGFEQANRGSLHLNGKDCFNATPAERPVAMLFQDNNLFPHLSVQQNIGLALKPSLKLTAEQLHRVEHIAHQMGIADLLPRKAEQLSGGQKQRAALARTLLKNKPILLLDEPFSALDPNRRQELLALVEQICIARNLTLLMVTHQLDETKSLFHRAIEVKEGQIINNLSYFPITSG